MGVGSRQFQTFLCDACGREIIAEEGSSVDGFYLEVLKVESGQQVGSENVFACSELCIPKAVSDALRRESLPEHQRITATQELWLKGQIFRTNPALPVYDAKDETRIIGTAHEIANYKPEIEI